MRLEKGYKTKGIVVAVSILCAIEFTYAPQVSLWNTVGVFPSIPVGVRFSVMEAVVGVFVVVIGVYLFSRCIFQRGRVRIAPPGFRALTVVFLFAVILSLGIGLALRSPSLFTEIREFIIPGSLVFIFLNLNVSKDTEYRVVRIFYWTGIASLAFGVVLFFAPWLVPAGMVRLPRGGFWIALYAGVFSGTWAAAQLLWNGFSWRSSLVVAAALGVFLLWISNKPILFTLIVAVNALVLAALLSRKSEIVARARAFSIGLPSVLVAAFVLIPQSVKTEFIKIFAWRYLKLRNISSIQELQSNLGQIGASEQDLSSSRFEIWMDYFQDAVSGLGLAPDGLGGAADVYTSLHGYQPGFPAHSSVAYLSYQAGYVAAIAYVLIGGLFLYQGFRYLPRQSNHGSVFQPAAIIAIFAFTVGIIAVGLVGGPLKDYRLSWFFWFSVAILIRRWSYLTDDSGERNNQKPNSLPE